MRALGRLAGILRQAGASLVAPAPDPRRVESLGEANELKAPDAYGLTRTPRDIRDRFARLEHAEPRGLRHIEGSLAAGFRRLHFPAGTNALNGLKTQYARFVLTARRIEKARIRQVDYMQHLAQDAFRHGLASLIDAFELVQVMETMDRKRLSGDIDALSREIDELRDTSASDELVQLKEDMLRSYRERLQRIHNHQARIQALLNQCERCEAALERAGIDLSQMKSESAPELMASTIEALRTTIERAREEKGNSAERAADTG
jgi:hypothetical protein